MTRPPNARGQGRKPLPPAQQTKPISIRLTAAHRLKLARLGGAAFLRRAIEKAKESTP